MNEPTGGTAADGHLRRHTLIGAVAGLLAGTGAALLLFLYGLVAAGTRAPVLVVLGGVLLGAAWGRWGPARAKGRPPVAGEPEADQRVRQAMAENEAAIDRAEEEPVAPTPELPDLEPPGPDDSTDWHRR